MHTRAVITMHMRAVITMHTRAVLTMLTRAVLTMHTLAVLTAAPAPASRRSIMTTMGSWRGRRTRAGGGARGSP
eukprot:1088990-Prorocentrum_minimum.AAC.1